MRYTKKYQKPVIVVFSIVTEDGVAFNFPSSITIPMNAKDTSCGFIDDEYDNMQFCDIALVTMTNRTRKKYICPGIKVRTVAYHHLLAASPVPEIPIINEEIDQSEVESKSSSFFYYGYE